MCMCGVYGKFPMGGACRSSRSAGINKQINSPRFIDPHCLGSQRQPRIMCRLRPFPRQPFQRSRLYWEALLVGMQTKRRGNTKQNTYKYHGNKGAEIANLLSTEGRKDGLRISCHVVTLGTSKNVCENMWKSLRGINAFRIKSIKIYEHRYENLNTTSSPDGSHRFTAPNGMTGSPLPCRLRPPGS